MPVSGKPSFSTMTTKNIIIKGRRPYAIIAALFCFPNNFGHDDYYEGIIRVTFIANFDKWNELDRPTYLQMKKKCAIRRWPPALMPASAMESILPQVCGVDVKLLRQDVLKPVQSICDDSMASRPVWLKAYG